MTAGPWLCRTCGTTWTADDVTPDEAGWWESPCGHVFGRNEPPPPLPHLATRAKPRSRPRTSTPRARATDPTTSHRAADTVQLRDTHRELLALFAAFGPMTDEQVADRWEGGPVSPSGLRTRRSELVDAGFVEWSGLERLTAAGRRTRAWRLSPEGVKLARPGPAPVADSTA